MNNLSDFANFGELQNFVGGRGGGAGKGGARRESAPRAPKTLATPLINIPSEQMVAMHTSLAALCKS